MRPAHADFGPSLTVISRTVKAAHRAAAMGARRDLLMCFFIPVGGRAGREDRGLSSGLFQRRAGTDVRRASAAAQVPGRWPVIRGGGWEIADGLGGAWSGGEAGNQPPDRLPPPPLLIHVQTY